MRKPGKRIEDNGRWSARRGYQFGVSWIPKIVKVDKFAVIFLSYAQAEIAMIRARGRFITG